MSDGFGRGTKCSLYEYVRTKDDRHCVVEDEGDRDSDDYDPRQGRVFEEIDCKFSDKTTCLNRGTVQNYRSCLCIDGQSGNRELSSTFIDKGECGNCNGHGMVQGENCICSNGWLPSGTGDQWKEYPWMKCHRARKRFQFSNNDQPSEIEINDVIDRCKMDCANDPDCVYAVWCDSRKTDGSWYGDDNYALDWLDRRSICENPAVIIN